MTLPAPDKFRLRLLLLLLPIVIVTLIVVIVVLVTVTGHRSQVTVILTVGPVKTKYFKYCREGVGAG